MKFQNTSVRRVDKEYSLEEIAAVLGISRQRVEQIEKSALQKLANAKNKEAWKDIMLSIEQLKK